MAAHALTFVLAAGAGGSWVAAHDRSFEGHPEWDSLWPDAFALNDLRGSKGAIAAESDVSAVADAPPDLSGVWTGSPIGSPKARYFLTPSGGGYGSSKDRAFAAEAPAPPGTAYDVRCITGDYTSDGALSCGWDSARVTVARTQKRRRRPLRNTRAPARSNDGGGRLPGKAGASSVGSNWTATFSFIVDGQVAHTKSGPIEGGNAAVDMDEPWNHFLGPLTGLWKGPGGDDYYVLTHDAASGNLTVFWDTSETPVGSWFTGDGIFNAKDNSVDMHFNAFELKGVTNAPDFTAIGNGTWGADWTKHPVQAYPSDIHTVHLIFMNHLDIGYTTTVNNVLNEYIHEYFTHVEQLADSMRKLEGTDRFVYITHPWLMSLLLDCPCGNATESCAARSLNNSLAPPLTCGTAVEVAAFERAVAKGDISWHAAPMNNQFENQSPALVEAGLKLTRMYDAMFYGNGTDDQKTITMSDRDVIYVTRAMIPYLSKYGVEGLTIGSNGANYPPQVPKLHVWKDEASGKDVIVVYHPYGYGGYSKSTCDGPGQCGDCAEAPNGVAICTEFRTDNTGPPASTDEILASLDAVRQEYPRASVFASTFDNFIRDVLPVKDQLPVVTKEVGDTWMYGAPSDPLKMAQSRELQRTWEDCLKREKDSGPGGKAATGEDSCDWDTSVAIRNMSRWLMKAPEHTWGTPGISGWGGGADYNQTVFHSKLNDSNYMAAASSWAEQRIYNALALAALEEAGHPLAAEARSRFEAVSHASAPLLDGFTKQENSSAIIQLTAGAAQTLFTVGFDESGAITTLTSTSSAVSPPTTQWASADHPLAALVYQTLNESDWKPFTYDYINGHGEPGGFSKPGSNDYTVSAHWRPNLQEVYLNADSSTVLAHMTMPSDAVHKYGASFSDAWLNVTVVGQGQLALELVTIGKTPTMVGESTMLTFAPATPLKKTGAWALDKIGSSVDPEDVIDGGNQFNHGVWDGGATAVTAAGGSFQVISLDAPNMCPQTPDFPWGNPLPAGSEGLVQLAPGSVFGMGVNLQNNLWGTNYPLYYPYYDAAYCTSPLQCDNADTRFRLLVNFH